MLKTTLLALVLITVLALAAGCAGQPASPTPQPTGPPTQTPSVPPTSPGQTTKPSPTTTTPTPSATSGIEVVASNLDTSWAMGFAPDGRIFVTERKGVIRIIKDGQLQAEPWMTLQVVEQGESGLCGLALDPQFTQNHFVYVAYTYRTSDGRMLNRLVRLREDTVSGKGAMDKILLDGVGASVNHDGGRVKFGPDGKLYWTMGDAEESSQAQDLSSLNGKIMRLNPDGTIPADNPFPNSPVYSYGHRNPQGLAWQPDTHRLYATEHGPSGPSVLGGRDEVNYIEPGKNYGWPVITGDQTREGMVTPVIQSGTDTWAPSGAAFVSGGPWDGLMLFAGLRGQSLYRLSLDKADPRKVLSFESLLTGQFGRLRDVVQGPDGRVYISTSNRDGRGQPSAGDDKILRLTVR